MFGFPVVNCYYLFEKKPRSLIKNVDDNQEQKKTVKRMISKDITYICSLYCRLNNLQSHSSIPRSVATVSLDIKFECTVGSSDKGPVIIMNVDFGTASSFIGQGP